MICANIHKCFILLHVDAILTNTSVTLKFVGFFNISQKRYWVSTAHLKLLYGAVNALKLNLLFLHKKAPVHVWTRAFASEEKVSLGKRLH